MVVIPVKQAKTESCERLRFVCKVHEGARSHRDQIKKTDQFQNEKMS